RVRNQLVLVSLKQIQDCRTLFDSGLSVTRKFRGSLLLSLSQVLLSLSEVFLSFRNVRVKFRELGTDSHSPLLVTVLFCDGEEVFEDSLVGLESRQLCLVLLDFQGEVPHRLASRLRRLLHVEERGAGIVLRYLESEPEVEGVAQHPGKVTHVI